jgi:3-hydroxyisobutyrate dehydrogenase
MKKMIQVTHSEERNNGMTQISFIGLGHMGNPMARNLLKAGFRVKVYDIVSVAVDALVSEGALAASSLRDAAESADVIITMLQTGEQVSKTCLSEGGLFQYARKGVLYIDSSSIDIVTTRSLHNIAANAGINMVDAPVSGGVAAAEAGTLTLMVGGEEKNFFLAHPVLEKIGKKIVHAGIGGSGQAAKICNNLLLGISMIGVCEAFSLAEKLDLDPKKFFEISSNASGQCWAMTSYCPVPGVVESAPSNRNYEPGFMAKMMLKDLRLGQHAAESVSACIPLGSEATELYALFVKQGFGEKDFSGIIEWLSGKNNKNN